MQNTDIKFSVADAIATLTLDRDMLTFDALNGDTLSRNMLREQERNMYDADTVALKALSKQVAMPVLYTNRHGAGEDFGNIDRFLCPACKRRLRNKQHDSYCPNCGQLLEWEEDYYKSDKSYKESILKILKECVGKREIPNVMTIYRDINSFTAFTKIGLVAVEFTQEKVNIKSKDFDETFTVEKAVDKLAELNMMLTSVCF